MSTLLNFMRVVLERGEGSTNLQTKLYSQEEKGSVVHSVPL